ncbi:phage baseplate assembly protein V [Acetobacter fallax]|uniref:Gp5/Type VI secretion system Vgr protein OB-fold domain-containing protein n=1 Tax=Acetobacter fallax TaxID=1737473 RepID=A0ABX0KAJ5_9PROT|nr:phage baseplate assembly protein V [Acetobacter fallax]NHO32021.1 hypothetical protein [Acetobacter fallax]NHO35463.1 hypothetical protein [Acetobacter fallax]
MKHVRGALDMMMHSHTNRIGRARFGVVSAVDPSSGLVKVRLQPENTETGWICDIAVSAGTVTCYAPSEIGNHVLVETAQGDGDNYVVVARVFDAASQPAKFLCLNGNALNPGQFGIKIGGVEFVVTDAGVMVKGNLIIDGDISVSSDVNASGISLVQHVHGGVQTGNSITDIPK